MATGKTVAIVVIIVIVVTAVAIGIYFAVHEYEKDHPPPSSGGGSSNSGSTPVNGCCCINGVSSSTTESDCESEDGTYDPTCTVICGTGSTTGCCCLDGNSSNITQSACNANSGTWDPSCTQQCSPPTYVYSSTGSSSGGPIWTGTFTVNNASIATDVYDYTQKQGSNATLVLAAPAGTTTGLNWSSSSGITPAPNDLIGALYGNELPVLLKASFSVMNIDSKGAVTSFM